MCVCLLFQFGCKPKVGLEDNPNQILNNECTKEELMDFTTQFNPPDYGQGGYLETPDSLISQFECYVEKIEYDSLNKYFSILMLKILKYHIVCCEHSMSLENWEHYDGETTLSRFSHNVIVFLFLRDIAPHFLEKEHLTSHVILSWLNENRNAGLMNDSLISSQIAEISHIKEQRDEKEK